MLPGERILVANRQAVGLRVGGTPDVMDVREEETGWPSGLYRHQHRARRWTLCAGST